MTFELKINCLWQHPARNSHLEITGIEWSEVFDPTVITGHSLRQLQLVILKISIKPMFEELTNIISTLQEFTNFRHFKNAHPLTRHLFKKLINPQSLTTRQQAQSKTKQTTFEPIQWWS